MIRISVYILLLLFLGCCIGCTPVPQPIHATIPPQTDYTAVFSWETACIMENETPNPHPEPSPTPDKVKVGDKCPTCYGTGRSGDGIQPCFQCSGDGKVDEGDPILGNTSPDQSNSSTTTTRPITILVEEYKEKYEVNVDGTVYTWNGLEFVSILGKKITPREQNFSPTSYPYISLCNGTSCRVIPITKRIVRTTNDRPQPITKSTNGSG